MARECAICGKGPNIGRSVSHSQRRTPKKWNANVQKIRAIVNGSPQNIYVCTKCIKSGKVVKA